MGYGGSYSINPSGPDGNYTVNDILGGFLALGEAPSPDLVASFYQQNWNGEVTNVSAAFYYDGGSIDGYNLSFNIGNQSYNNTYSLPLSTIINQVSWVSGKEEKYLSLSGKLSGASLALSLTDAVSLTTIEAGFNGAAAASGLKSFSQAKAFLKGANAVKSISRGIAVSTIGLSVIDGLSNPEGWQKHNTIDVVVGTASILFPGFGLAYGIFDIGSQIFTGKSISEHVEGWIKGN